MARLVDNSVVPPVGKLAAGATVEPPRAAHTAKTSNKR
jgi:hypothetical protein